MPVLRLPLLDCDHSFNHRFAEVNELSEADRQFKIILILFSIGTEGYFATMLISLVFEGQIVQLVRGRRMERAIVTLEDHYIICGCGVMEKQVAPEFLEAGERFVVIERDSEASEFGRDESILFIEGMLRRRRRCRRPASDEPRASSSPSGRMKLTSSWA